MSLSQLSPFVRQSNKILWNFSMKLLKLYIVKDVRMRNELAPEPACFVIHPCRPSVHRSGRPCEWTPWKLWSCQAEGWCANSWWGFRLGPSENLRRVACLIIQGHHESGELLGCGAESQIRVQEGQQVPSQEAKAWGGMEPGARKPNQG